MPQQPAGAFRVVQDVVCDSQLPKTRGRVLTKSNYSYEKRQKELAKKKKKEEKQQRKQQEKSKEPAGETGMVSPADE